MVAKMINRYRNPVLQEFHRKAEQWYRDGRNGHCWPARQDAYKLLLIRHGTKPLKRHVQNIKAVLDSCENELRMTYGLGVLAS